MSNKARQKHIPRHPGSGGQTFEAVLGLGCLVWLWLCFCGQVYLVAVRRLSFLISGAVGGVVAPLGEGSSTATVCCVWSGSWSGVPK